MSKMHFPKLLNAQFGFAIIYHGYMSYDATNEVYTLDRIDTEEQEKFMTERNV